MPESKYSIGGQAAKKKQLPILLCKINYWGIRKTSRRTLKNRNVSYTEYVEMIVLLHQQNPDDTIKIDLVLGELDVTSAEVKATHQEIKDYVLKELVHI